MFRRLFWLCVGAGFGFGSSFWVTRRLQQLVARWTPAGIRDRVRIRLDELRDDVLDAAEAGRVQMARRELELRGQLHPRLQPPAGSPRALPTGGVTPSADGQLVDAEVLMLPAGAPRHARGRRSGRGRHPRTRG